MWQGAETDASLSGAPDCMEGSDFTFGHHRVLVVQRRSSDLPVKGSLDMQSDSLITVLSFYFLSDSPLDSHVNMRPCTWYRLRSTTHWKLSPPFSSVGSLLSLRARLKSRFISDWRYCLVVSDLRAPCYMDVLSRCFKDGVACGQTVSVLASWISSISWT